MENTKKHDLSKILRILAKKGVYEIFMHVKSHEGERYNTILSYALSQKLVKSRASMNTAITELSDLGLLSRKVIQSRPVRTCYSVNNTGHKVMKYLTEIEEAINES